MVWFCSAKKKLSYLLDLNQLHEGPNNSTESVIADSVIGCLTEMIFIMLSNILKETKEITIIYWFGTSKFSVNI